MATPRPGDERDLIALDRDHVFHPYTSIDQQRAAGARVWSHAEGIRVTGADGHEAIDAMSGLWCVAAGYGRSEIAEAMAEQARRLPYAHGFVANANAPAIELAARLARLTPTGLDHAFFCNSGSEANDTIVKLAWYYWNLRGRPEKKKIIARDGAYHGVTIAATSLSGLPHMHALFDLPLPGFLHVRKPHHYREAAPGESEADFSRRLAQELEALILTEGPDTIAAFIGEPVMAAGGVVPPPEGYWAEIQAVLRRHEILFVADEVVCGFGRLGEPFGSHVYDLAPDFMTVAKAITSAYFPVSAAMVSHDLFEVLAKASPEVGAIAHGHTTSLHPIGAAAALANLDILEGEGLLERAKTTGPFLQDALRDAIATHPLVGEVRGTGLLAAVELVADREEGTPFDPEEKVGARLAALAYEAGLIVRPLGDSLGFCPPLIADRGDLEEIVARFTRAMDRLADERGC